MELIVAVSESGIIGRNNKLPWRLPNDLRRFKSLTKGHIVVMGRKTFDSLPNNKLPNRINIVITRNENKIVNDVIYTNMDNIFDILKNYDKKVFIIGGSEIYSLFFDMCKIIHITKVFDIEEEENDIKLKFDIFKACEQYEMLSCETFIENRIKYQFLDYQHPDY